MQPVTYSFSELLKAGDMPRALQLRLESLEAAARHYRQDLEAAKCTAAAVGAIGLMMSASPAIAVIAAAGLGSYAYTLLRDFAYTKRLCPVPLVRKSIGDLVLGVGLAADNERQEEDPLLDVLGYLPPQQAWEYELIACSEREIASYLASVATEDRMQAYKYMLRNTRLRGKLKVPGATVTVSATTEPVIATQDYDEEPITETTMTKTTSPYAKNRSAAPSVQSWEPEQFDFIAEMGKCISNTLIVGIPGAGKGVVVSNAVRSVRQHHPQKTIMWIDPKNDPQETGYFAVDGILARRADITQMNPLEVLDWLQKCIAEFEALPGEKLLIIDESVMIIGVLKTIKDAMDWLKRFLLGLITTGDSRGKNCWVVAQSSYLEDIGVGGGIASQMTRVALVCGKNISALGALLRTNFIPNIAKVDNSVLQNLMSKSPVDRCYYHGGKNKWYSMPKLTNYSGIDRDTRTIINVHTETGDPFL